MQAGAHNLVAWTAGGSNVYSSNNYNPDSYYGTWRHYAWVADGSKINNYRNGIFTISDNKTPGNVMSATASSMFIGAGYGASNKMTGQIDDLRLYNRALSATEILALYNLGL